MDKSGKELSKKVFGFCNTEKAIEQGYRTQWGVDKNICSNDCDTCDMFCYEINGKIYEGKQAHQEYSKQF